MAEKFLRNASKDVAERAGARLREPPLRELCKTRIGSYRVVYLIKPCNITVVHISKRESVYDELKHSW